jgi:hypothetical protein
LRHELCSWLVSHLGTMTGVRYATTTSKYGIGTVPNNRQSLNGGQLMTLGDSTTDNEQALG